jgi:hypothetical protein
MPGLPSLIKDRFGYPEYDILHPNLPPMTEKGRDLEPAMRVIIDWGLKHVPGTGRITP